MAHTDDDVFALVAHDVGVDDGAVIVHRVHARADRLEARTLALGGEWEERVREVVREALLGLGVAVGAEVEVFTDEAPVANAFDSLATAVACG